MLDAVAGSLNWSDLRFGYMTPEPTGAFKFQLTLKATNNLNGDWGSTDWLNCMVFGDSKTGVYEKFRMPLSDEDLKTRYQLTAKQCRLLIRLLFDFRASRFASVLKRIEAISEDSDYRDIETYVFWFAENSFGRSDLAVSEDITADSSPDLYQALQLLDRGNIEIVSIIFSYVTEYVLNAESS